MTILHDASGLADTAEFPHQDRLTEEVAVQPDAVETLSVSRRVDLVQQDIRICRHDRLHDPVATGSLQES